MGLWLWPADVALTEPLAWEPPYATDLALKKKKNLTLSFQDVQLSRQSKGVWDGVQKMVHPSD